MNENELARVIKLIKAVSEYPCLWNPRHSQFNNAIVKNKSWESVAAKIGRDPDDCRSVWHKAFDSYLKAMKSTALAPKFICRLTQHFQFLLPIVMERVKQTVDTNVSIDLSVDEHIIENDIENENGFEECNGDLEEACPNDGLLNQNFNEDPLEVCSVEEVLNKNFVGDGEQSTHNAFTKARQEVRIDRSQARNEWMSFFHSNISDILALDESKQRKLKRTIIEDIQQLHDEK